MILVIWEIWKGIHRDTSHRTKNGTFSQIKIDETITAKKGFEISQLLKLIAKEVVERGIKNDVKKYSSKDKKENDEKR